MPRARKTQALIRIDTKALPPTGLDDILRVVFWRDPTLAYIAEELVEKLATEGPLEASKWRETIEELGTTKTTYYSVLSGLKAAGLVDTRNGIHDLSTVFANRLEELSEYWDSYVKKTRRTRSDTTTSA